MELVFEGLDTIADVYLNGKLILKADNFFRTWVIDVKQSVVVGLNRLSVNFLPIKKIIENRKHHYSPLRFTSDHAYVRKPWF